MISNKGQVQINNLLVANQKHGIAKIKGCLIKGRPVTSRPLNCQKKQYVAEGTDNSGSKIREQRDEQKRYLNSTPYVELIQESSLINACPMAARSTPAPKTCKKSKQPIIRSYIIRQNQDLTPQSMFYNCNAEHNKFVNLLNQCINKRSLTTSKDQRKAKISPPYDKNDKEDKMLCQSFNNVKVKQSLQSIFLSQLDIIMSPRQALANSYLKHNLKRPHSQTKGQCRTNQRSQNGTAQNEEQRWRGENEFYSDYTNITDYMIERNMTQKDSSAYNSLLASSNFATVNNYSNFCRLKYKRKKKQSLKLSKNMHLQKQKNNNISKSHHLKDNSILHKGKYNGSCLNKKEKGRQDEGNPEDKYNINEDIKIQDFQIFTGVGSRTPPKRKISTSFYSPEKLIIGSPQKLSKQQKQKLSKTSIKKQRIMERTQQCEEGNSCYLRTINF